MEHGSNTGEVWPRVLQCCGILLAVALVVVRAILHWQDLLPTQSRLELAIATYKDVAHMFVAGLFVAWWYHCEDELGPLPPGRAVDIDRSGRRTDLTIRFDWKFRTAAMLTAAEVLFFFLKSL